MDVIAVVKNIDIGDNGSFVITIDPRIDNAVFIQDQAYTQAGIAVTPYGSVMYDGTSRPNFTGTLKPPTFTVNGKEYASTLSSFITKVGEALTVNALVDSEIAYSSVGKEPGGGGGGAPVG